MRLESPTYDNKKENLPPATNSSTSVDLSKECDAEDITKPSPTLIERDRVREYLEKNPTDRTEKDIQFLLDFMQHMPAFSNMTMSMKRSLCRVMVFALVERAGTVVLKDGEKLDSWSVILNGHVEVAKPDGTIQHLHMGDSFGVSITRDTMMQEGVMTTKSDDCQFVCIPQDDFYDILHREKENIIKIEDASGEVVMVMEKRESEERGNFVQGKVVLRATPDMLMKQLMEDNVMDETYTSDFLLTYRTFMKSPVELADYLFTCLKGTNADKAMQVIHSWVLNHFVDFESNTELFGKLEKFIDALKEKNMLPQVTHLQQTCSERARMRHVLFVLKNDEEPLQFVLAGGQERNSKIFVSHVDEKSPASKAGLRVADQIISVNNHNLDGITLEKAYEFLQMTNHLMLTVKSNLLDFEKLKMKASLRDCTSPSSPTLNDQTIAPKQASEWGRAHLLPRDLDGNLSSSDSPLRGGKRSDQSPQSSRLRQALGKMNLMQKSETSENYTGFRNSISSTSGILDSSSLCSWSNNISFNQSMDLQNASKSSALFPLGSSCQFSQEETSAIVVYRADQTHKHILVKRSTTVQEAIGSLLLEFEITDSPGQYSLCQITLDEDGTIKTKHLPNHVSDLAERCTLNSRYYLRDIRRMEKLITAELTSVLLTDVNFLQLPFGEVAWQLTQRDMQLFCSIDPVEYVNDLFEISSVPQLTRFSELVNEEMFWVVTEVCSEPNCLKRSKILKQFIKIAEKCHKLKNFNSMFAILSGLGHGSVSRLRQTWEKLPDKYCKLFEEMQGVMDPSRNMLKYRNLLLSSQSPLIPFFPLVKKDLTFIHFGNDSRIDGLINFDKLRMIAKEIRLIFKMASVSCSDKLSTSKNSLESLISSGSSSSLISVTPSKKFAPPFASSSSLTTPSINALNAKKIYEEGQTSRTVKTYIANLKIISDENKLSVMSLTCESNGKSSRKPPAPSSASIVCRPVFSCQVTGPRFGSENPTAIMKIMSLSEAVKPLNSVVVKNISSSPANCKNVSSDKNKNKLQPPHLHLSTESSSVLNVRKNSADEHSLARPSNVTPSTSNSSLSLSSSSSSSSSNENKSCPSANDKITEIPAQMLILSSLSSHATSQLLADDLSSSMSSGICSLESASSLHHHHHQQHVQQRCNCCDVDIGDELDNLPDDGVDDDDDDDYNGRGDDDDDDDDDVEPVNGRSSCQDNLPFISTQHGSNGTLCMSDSSTASSKRQSIDVDLNPDVSPSPNQTSSSSTYSNSNSPSFLHSTSTEAVQSSAVYQNKTDATANGSRLPSPSKQNSARQLFREEAKHLDHRSSVSSASSPSSYVAHQKSSLLLPSYDQLLSMKQNVPSHGCPPNHPHLSYSKPRSSIPSPVDSHAFGDAQSHSKCCCCSVCFQSSYHYHHYHHHHHYLPQNNALEYCNGSSGGKVVSFASPEISLQHHQKKQHQQKQQHQQRQQQQQKHHQVPSSFSRGFQNVDPLQQHVQHFNEPLMTTIHVAPRSCDQLCQMPNEFKRVPSHYQPYATVHEDDDGELVTLV